MLEGRLGDFTLPDILRLLAFTAKSGRLWVSEGDAVARVDILEGRIRDASADTATLGLARRLLGQDLVDADTLTGVLEDLETLPTDLELARRLVESDTLESSLLADLAREQLIDALFELLRWPEGAFRFEAGTAEQRGPSVLDLALSVDDALDEVGRRLEAHGAVEERTGTPDAVVTIRRPGRERAEVGLSPEGWTLLGLVDGRRTVADLVHLSGQGDYRTRRTLASLLDEGIVAVGDATELPPAERLVRAHRALADHEARLGGASAPLADEHAQEPEHAGRDEPAAGELTVEPSGAQGPSQAPVAEQADVAEQVAEPERPDVAERVAEPGQPEQPAAAATDEAAAAGETARDEPSSAPGATPPGVTPLRASARRPQLRTDPDVDEELLQRLIDGVESL